MRILDVNPRLFAEVLKGLRARLSLEQIAGQLWLDFPDDPEVWASHETIYQSLSGCQMVCVSCVAPK
jgi:transposase, IS30 family